MLGRRLFIAAGTMALCVAVALVGGWPDLALSVDLLTGRNVTAASESALVTLLCWLAAMALVVVAVRAFRSHHNGRGNRPRVWSVAVLVIGIVLLGAGISRVRGGGYRVCCATATTAQQAEQLVH